MKRKLLVAFLALACTLCCAFGLTACGCTCDHIWDDGVETSQPTCTEDGETLFTCTKCGNTKVEKISALGHDLQNDECSRCGYVNGGGGETGGEQHEHTWSAWTVTTAATCTEAGEEQRICASDNTHKETRDIAALDHSWGEWTQTKAPSCTEAGEEQRICANDSSHTETQALNTTEHNYKNYYCTACGEIDPTAPISEGLEFTLSEDGTNYSVTGIGTCTDKDVVIPSIHDGKPVISIGIEAFSDCDTFTSVTIPDSVTSIGAGAFARCNSLLSITIPDGVTSIEYAAFYLCGGLLSVTIPDSVTSIGDYAFEGCYKLVEVYNLSKLKIEKGAFSYGYVGYYALDVYNLAGQTSKLDKTSCPDFIFYVGGDTRYLIGYTGDKTDVTLPESYKGKSYDVYQYAFNSCTSLTSVTIPDGVTSIGEGAFSNCSSLTSVTIPDSVTSIGKFAFYYCSGLTGITFKGTMEQWNTIEKGSNWNYNTGKYTVYCTNGEIKK